MKRRLMLIIFILLLFSSCNEEKPYSDIANVTKVMSEHAEQTLEHITISNLYKNKYEFLKDQHIELSYLVNAKWNDEGDGICIFMLNDVAEYTDGQVMRLYFSDVIFKDLCKHSSENGKVSEFIDSINYELKNNASSLLEYQVNDLVITLKFLRGNEIIFTGYYDALRQN